MQLSSIWCASAVRGTSIMEDDCAVRGTSIMEDDGAVKGTSMMEGLS